MKILALELSFAQRSVAALIDGRVGGRATVAPGSSLTPLQLVDQALNDAALEREQIECLAVGLGPGSYTGIRAGIALAQGWQLARAVRLVGISSVECLAAGALAIGFRGRVGIVIDAQRGEFYLATYLLEPDGARLAEPLQLADTQTLQSRIDLGEILVGPQRHPDLGGIRTLFPDAAILGRLAVGRTDFAEGSALQPLEIRTTVFVKAAPPRAVPALAPAELPPSTRAAPRANP